MSGAILHLSDIHFGTENKAAVEGAWAFAASRSFDLIAISGDVTSFGTKAEFAAARAWIRDLPGPVLVTPGNHDTPYAGLIARAIYPWARYRRAFGNPDTVVFDTPALAARTFNTARGVQLRTNWSKGAARLVEVDHVVASFASAAPSALRMVMCHHPLTEVTGGPMTGEVRRGDAAAERLAGGQVDLVLTGHVHTPFFHPFSEGDGHCHAVGAATLSTRERGAPAGFNVIEWDDEDIRVTAQGWSGSHFEPYRTWAASRRVAAEGQA